jgi:AraC-like DNA-binding protein
LAAVKGLPIEEKAHLAMGGWQTHREGSAVQSDPAQLPFLWTRGIAARETLYYLDRNGIDATTILSMAELSRAQLTEDPGGVSVASQHRFLELAANEANDPLLGLHVAAGIDLRDIGLLYYLAAASATVLEALEHLARYSATSNEEVRVEIAHRADETVLSFVPALELGEPRRQYSELVTLAFNRVLRALANRDFSPSRISFAHARNWGLREAHRILKCPLEFAQATDCWVLPKSVMELPIVSEDKRLLHILETHADDLLSERRAAVRLRGVVEHCLLSMLSSGKAQAALVADQLGMSERSLRRQLAEEGTSFAEVLDRLRHRLALRYLEDQRASLQQIAWLLGYSEIGAFNHAFKRWTGTSPGRARRAKE